MEHIEVRDDSAARRRRERPPRSAVLAAFALVALALAGCSASGGGADSGSVPGVVEEGGGALSDEQPAEVADDRTVVIEGSMTIVVEDVADATDAATALVRGAGGRIDGREEAFDEYDGDEHAVTTMVLRIPAEDLDDTIADLRELGSVESLQTSTTDVTTAVEDIDAHVAALQSTIARLESFQAEATSVDDLLDIEAEIAARQAELEGYLAQQADYAEQVSFSTITLSLRSEPAPIAEGPDSFWSGLLVGVESLLKFLAGLAIVLGVMLPWLIAIGVLALAIVLLVRWLRRRRPPQPPVAPPGPAMPWAVQDQPAPPVGVGGTPPTP